MTVLHATAVALEGRGIVILGPAGAGKTSLALALMGMGAVLVSDDQTVLTREGAQVLADAPATLRGRIEARGVGILNAAAAGPVPVHLAVDLGRREEDRLPQFRDIILAGLAIPLVLGPPGPHLAPALRQYLLAGRAE